MPARSPTPERRAPDVGESGRRRGSRPGRACTSWPEVRLRDEDPLVASQHLAEVGREGVEVDEVRLGDVPRARRTRRTPAVMAA